jgi:hypothetical protein
MEPKKKIMEAAECFLATSYVLLYFLFFARNLCGEQLRYQTLENFVAHLKKLFWLGCHRISKQYNFKTWTSCCLVDKGNPPHKFQCLLEQVPMVVDTDETVGIYRGG